MEDRHDRALRIIDKTERHLMDWFQAWEGQAHDTLEVCRTILTDDTYTAEKAFADGVSLTIGWYSAMLAGLMPKPDPGGPASPAPAAPKPEAQRPGQGGAKKGK